MSKANSNLEKYIWIAALCALTAIYQCTEEQPIIVQEDKGSIIGVIKPLEVIAEIKVIQGIVIDSTFSDSASGYFEIKNLSYGTYSLEVTAQGYGKYHEDRIEVNGITAIGNIYLRPIPEQILTIKPYNDSENIALITPCIFEFSTLMDHTSVENGFEISPAVDGYFQWEESGNKSIVNFYPNPRYKAFTTYTFNLTPEAKTIYGDTLAFKISSRFTTEPVKVESHSPESESNYISCSTVIYVRFNTAMNRTTVENSFEILRATPGIFVWHNNESFSYKPTDFLATNTLYTVTISRNAKDLYGTSLYDQFTYNFTTEPLQVSYTYPLNGATNVNLNTNIQVVFNVSVDQKATEKAFSIDPSVAGTFGWTDLTRFSFYPEQSFEAQTNYVITIDTNCKDLFGKSLLESYTFSFVTQAQ